MTQALTQRGKEMNQTVLAFKGVSKSFPGVQALKKYHSHYRRARFSPSLVKTAPENPRW